MTGVVVRGPINKKISLNEKAQLNGGYHAHMHDNEEKFLL